MKPRFFLVLAVAEIAVLLGAGNASARGPANEFAVGSAKTDIVDVADAHASFSAHNTGVGCSATGQIVYDSPALAITAKIEVLVIVGQGAYLGGTITKVTRGGVSVGEAAYFDAFDSQQPGGIGDQFSQVLVLPAPSLVCVEPLPAIPITRGNIVIQGLGL